MSSKTIPNAFQQFHKAKIKFVQAVSDFSQRPANIEPLNRQDVIAYLKPLLQDVSVSIRNSAAVSLGRISNHSPSMAQNIIRSQVLPSLVKSLGEQNVIYKKAVCFVLKSLAKHSIKLAQSVINSGALQELAVCLQQFDQGVKQSAASVIASMAKHNKQMAMHVAQSGSIPNLVLSLQQPNPQLKKMSALAIYQISKHGNQLAQNVVDQGAVMVLSQLITHHDTHLKRQVCQCLSSIARHSNELAQVVVDSDVYPKIFYRLKDLDDIVRKNSANLIKQIVKQSPQMAKLFVKKGGISPLIQFITQSKGSFKMPGILALGYISAFDHGIATQVISAKAIQPLKQAIIQVADDHVKSTVSWTLGQIGGHSPTHAKVLAQQDVLTHLLAVYVFKSQSKKALKSVVRMLQDVHPLQKILKDSPPQIQKHLVRQLSKNLANNKYAQKQFVMQQGLRKLQNIQAQPGTKLREAIDEIVAMFPTDIIQYYNPNYQQTLIQKMT